MIFSLSFMCPPKWQACFLNDDSSVKTNSGRTFYFASKNLPKLIVRGYRSGMLDEQRGRALNIARILKSGPERRSQSRAAGKKALA